MRVLVGLAIDEDRMTVLRVLVRYNESTESIGRVGNKTR